MEEQLSEENIRQIREVYAQLEGLWDGLDGRSDWVVAGPLAQYEQAIDELKAITSENFSHFMPHTEDANGGESKCHSQDLRAQISGLLGKLRARYLPEQLPHFIKDSPDSRAAVTQNVFQDVNVTQQAVILVDIAEVLAKKENDFVEGSKERAFITKMKDGLKQVSNVTQLLVLIMNTAHETGLGLEKLKHIFS